MAVQLNADELKGCISYFEWLTKKVTGSCSDNSDELKAKTSMCRYLFDTDFYVVEGIENDDTQAKNGMDLRRRYAESEGARNSKSDREIDRIWKSVHGKCSVFELILNLCIRLDEMTNEEESGAFVERFFDMLMANLEMDITGNLDDWRVIIDRFLARKYDNDGSGGGLFPLNKWDSGVSKDQPKVPIWFQMNTWLNENLDDDGQFIW